MLVVNRRVLERAVPRRWNLVALPMAALLVAAVTTLGSRPAGHAAEPLAAGSDDDPSAPPAESPRPARTVDDLFGEPPKEPRTDGKADPLPADEPNPRPAVAPTDARVDMELEKDPIVQELTRHLATALVQLAQAKSLSPDDIDDGMLKEMQRLVQQLQESIDERKAQVRPTLLARLAREQPAVELPPRARAFRSVAPFRGRIRPGDMLNIDLAGGFPTSGPRDPATVEPDGNLALGVLYGGRINVAGTTLSEAEEIIEKRLVLFLKDPQVQVTYEGHNPDIEPAGAEAERQQFQIESEEFNKKFFGEPKRQPRVEPTPEKEAVWRHLENLEKEGQFSAIEHERRQLQQETDQLVKKLKAEQAKRPQPTDKLEALSQEVENLRLINAQLKRELKILEQQRPATSERPQ